MNDKLMTDIGENYEYVRTIVNNKIELFKIDLAQNTAKILGFIILGFFLLSMMTIFVASLIIALAFAIAEAIGSTVFGFLIASLLVMLISFIVFYFRKSIFFNPVAKMFYKKIADKI